MPFSEGLTNNALGPEGEDKIYTIGPDSADWMVAGRFEASWIGTSGTNLGSTIVFDPLVAVGGALEGLSIALAAVRDGLKGTAGAGEAGLLCCMSWARS